MQLYSTVFPINEKLTKDLLINLIIKWNQESQYNKIHNLTWDGVTRNLKFEEKNHSLQIEELRAYNIIASRFLQNDHNNVIWTTDIVVDFEKKLFSLKLDRETTSESESFSASFKPPYLVKMILKDGYAGTDAGLPINQSCFEINRKNYSIIADIINKKTLCSMPVVYVTKNYDRYPLDVEKLAYSLRGVAHVLIEEDSSVSRQDLYEN